MRIHVSNLSACNRPTSGIVELAQILSWHGVRAFWGQVWLCTIAPQIMQEVLRPRCPGAKYVTKQWQKFDGRISFQLRTNRQQNSVYFVGGEREAQRCRAAQTYFVSIHKWVLTHTGKWVALNGRRAGAAGRLLPNGCLQKQTAGQL